MPDQGVGYFFSVNTWSPGEVFREIDRLLFDYVTRGINSPASPPERSLPSDIGEWTGFYEPGAPRQEKLKFADLLTGGVAIYLRDGKLYRHPVIARSQRMIPAGGHLFRTEMEPIATAVFALGDAGQRVMVSHFTPGLPVPIYFEKTQAFWPITRLVLLVAAILALVTSVSFALIWLPRKLLGRMRGVRHLSVRAVPLLAALAFGIDIWAAYGSTPLELAQPDLRTITMCLSTIVFAILSLVALVLSIRSFSLEMNRAARIHSLLVSLWCFGLTSYAAYWGLIGVRTWAAF
jgi:hypothetical protein